ncbi:MAG: amidohydrolase family protein, partial [Acidimicrobiia bacterium]|nr:amidohydrolase family protein [Acidimicrobiia bacterium]
MRQADGAGYQVLVHAQGDLAIEQVQDAYAEVLGDGGNPLRHRIDHNVFVTPRNESRFGELDIMAVTFAASAACTPDIGWTDFYMTYGDRPNAIGLANPDLRVASHGDDPSLPPIDPILDVYSLTTRNAFAEDGSICEAPDWMVGGAVDTKTALEMVTINAAYALRQDDVVGSLTPG